MNKPWIAVLAGGLLSLSAVAEQHTALELSNAWVRALPPAQTRTAAYLTLANPGAAAVSVVGASADLADKVEIHTTREIDGYMRMEQLQGLTVAAGQRVQLAPGGTHLMLLGLARMPAPGDSVRLCLELASGDEVCTMAAVRKTAPGQGEQNPHQHHHQE